VVVKFYKRIHELWELGIRLLLAQRMIPLFADLMGIKEGSVEAVELLFDGRAERQNRLASTCADSASRLC
jgi:hypothetical protein